MLSETVCQNSLKKFSSSLEHDPLTIFWFALYIVFSVNRLEEFFPSISLSLSVKRLKNEISFIMFLVATATSSRESYKVAKEFDKVVNEGWIHYQNIQQAKEGIINED